MVIVVDFRPLRLWSRFVSLSHRHESAVSYSMKCCTCKARALGQIDLLYFSGWCVFFYRPKPKYVVLCHRPFCFRLYFSPLNTTNWNLSKPRAGTITLKSGWRLESGSTPDWRLSYFKFKCPVLGNFSTRLLFTIFDVILGRRKGVA